MKPLRLLLLIIAFTIGIGVVLSVFSTPKTPQITIQPEPEADEEIEPEDIYTLEEKVGQLFVVGHFSYIPVASTTQRIKEARVGGVILMDAPNNSELIADWTEEWQSVSTIPLSISIDQEGGVVSRLKSDEYIPTAQSLITDETTAYSIAAKRADSLHELGINTNLSPVLDRSIEPTAFMYDRTFRNPNLIASLGHQMVVGYQNQHVLAVPKHFPGHPDTDDDSHITLPIVTGTEEDYYAHTAQFSDIVALGDIKMLMSAHVSVPALDTIYPATLSKVIIDDLRDRIRFEGALITDDIAMDAISNTWTHEEAAVLALQAGADIILIASQPEKLSSTVEAVLAAVETGDIPEERIDEAFTRVQAAKKVFSE